MHCPCCNSTDLTEPGSYASFENHARFKSSRAGWFGPKPVKVKPEVARICLNCGYYLLFATEVKVEELKSREKVG